MLEVQGSIHARKTKDQAMLNVTEDMLEVQRSLNEKTRAKQVQTCYTTCIEKSPSILEKVTEVYDVLVEDRHHQRTQHI